MSTRKVTALEIALDQISEIALDALEGRRVRPMTTSQGLSVGDRIVYYAPNAGALGEYGVVTALGLYGTFVRFNGETRTRQCVGGSITRVLEDAS